jgi:bifunctional UDP-N-acetylglucosamine pyrophosphorylase/glucosamine-1-phosphate N-acetyltransferase
VSRSLLAVVVLAAGEGTRMRSRTVPKVLHGFAGRTLLAHVLAAVEPLAAAETVVVVGHGRDHVAAAVPAFARAVVQDQQLGTGHAVAVALSALPADAAGTVLVVPGDAPLLRTDTLRRLAESAADVTVLTSELADPTGYGRVLRAPDGSVARIVEQKDASADELRVREVGTSVYAFDAELLRDAVQRLSTANAQGEQYLTDVIGLAVADGRTVTAVCAAAAETAGVNDRVQLAAAARIYNDRLLEEHMRAGVTVVDPATTWIDAAVRLDPDVTLLPGTELHGTTTIREGAVIGPQTTLTDTDVGPGARLERTVAVQARVGAEVTVGPFAYLRPGTVLADAVHVGTYVELKNASVGAGTKIPHLSYVGDATIGEQTNIGAATVFVNYDGVRKHHTTIGSHARTGADNMFVAPVTVGDGAYTAAGAVITKDVPAGALGRSSARQQNVSGWVLERRAGTAAAEAAERAGADRQSEE